MSFASATPMPSQMKPFTTEPSADARDEKTELADGKRPLAAIWREGPERLEFGQSDSMKWVWNAHGTQGQTPGYPLLLNPAGSPRNLSYALCDDNSLDQIESLRGIEAASLLQSLLPSFDQEP